MKARPPEQTPGGLPAELAAGPFTERWLVAGSYRAAQAAWSAAGQRWSTEHDLRPHGWVDLLSDDVAHWAKSLGRMHARSLDDPHRNNDPKPPPNAA